jgi:hypothetical protein
MSFCCIYLITIAHENNSCHKSMCVCVCVCVYVYVCVYAAQIKTIVVKDNASATVFLIVDQKKQKNSQTKQSDNPGRLAVHACAHDQRLCTRPNKNCTLPQVAVLLLSSASAPAPANPA